MTANEGSSPQVDKMLEAAAMIMASTLGTLQESPGELTKNDVLECVVVARHLAKAQKNREAQLCQYCC